MTFNLFRNLVVAEKLMQTESTTSHHQSPIGGEDVIAWFRKESCLNNVSLYRFRFFAIWELELIITCCIY